jgi:predicted metalloprotease with PDZ domain
MARESAEFLARDPDKTLVVLVGSAHVLHGSAIPERVKRRIDASNAVIVTAPFTPLPGIDPDYVLAPRDIQLPPRGRTGLTLLQKGDRVLVRGVLPGSAAEKAGIAPGDRIRRIGKVPVQGLADVRLALTDSAPGDRLTVSIEPEGSDTGKRSERVLRLL